MHFKILKLSKSCVKLSTKESKTHIYLTAGKEPKNLTASTLARKTIFTCISLAKPLFEVVHITGWMIKKTFKSSLHLVKIVSKVG